MQTTGEQVLAVPARAVSRPARLGRGALAAAFSTFVALASHVLAGGAMPGLLGVLVPLVFATSASIAQRKLSSLSAPMRRAVFVIDLALCPPVNQRVTASKGAAPRSQAWRAGSPTRTSALTRTQFPARRISSPDGKAS